MYDKEERDVYFVYPNMMNHPLILPRLRRMTIATAYAWPAGTLFLWPVPFPDEKGRVKVWKSARRAFEISCGLATDLDPPGPRWTQMVWNAEARDYDVGTAEGINSTADLAAGPVIGKLAEARLRGQDDRHGGSLLCAAAPWPYLVSSIVSARSGDGTSNLDRTVITVRSRSRCSRKKFDRAER